MDKRESEGTVEEPLDLIKLSLDERMYQKLIFIQVRETSKFLLMNERYVKMRGEREIRGKLHVCIIYNLYTYKFIIFIIITIIHHITKMIHAKLKLNNTVYIILAI